ncbi:MAG: ABC transporter ATP-binding protein [Deltaproteobacteria bacterium RIFCSPLOWO2_02_FULL_53_8]|nr:MAG: ABC transporter ATP-binding protein [Deltaproteobacteria bacterium RIFCSPLOWO2_02_FULL_53_8]
MNPLVEVRELTKLFGSVKAVDNISFDVYEGEILGIIGPNGAGKTTTLQMLLDLTTPTFGEIRIFGMTLASNRPEILAKVNFSSSYISLPHSLTVRENLKIFAKLYGVDSPAARIRELASAFEIDNLMDVPVRRLSSGQITRVCLAKSLLNDPKILFLDEPTASLDPDIADKTRAMLKRIKAERGLSILYSSHNMQEMEEISDRVIFMDHGRIIAVGRPAEIKAQFDGASLEEVFLKVARR